MALDAIGRFLETLAGNGIWHLAYGVFIECRRHWCCRDLFCVHISLDRAVDFFGWDIWLKSYHPAFHSFGNEAVVCGVHGPIANIVVFHASN